MRGTIDLTGHKLANVYRAPAPRSRHRAYRIPHERDEIYRQLVRLIDGAVRDCFANHPEFLTKAGQRAARASLVKRAAGTLWGYGKEVSFSAQAARGRSVVVESAPPTPAVQLDLALFTEPDPTATGLVVSGEGAVIHALADNRASGADGFVPMQGIGIGHWRLRNGVVVVITRALSLDCGGPDGRFTHRVWAGHCLCCQSKFTWEPDGRYAAVGTHAFDIVAKEEEPSHG